MKIARKPRPVGDIDVTSFSDIAFLLIIFFVLTTTFTRTMGLAVIIPASTQDPAKKAEAEYPTVVLAPETMKLHDKDVTLDDLRQALAEMKLPEKKEDARFIVLESSPEVEYERYFQVVTAISKAGGILAIAEPIEGANAENKDEAAPGATAPDGSTTTASAAGGGGL
jgi:biopolymer transport protein ExbD